jgi:hypothetical protein
VDSRLVLLAHLGATWYMTGLIWFVQIVHYPLMLIEVVTAVLLLVRDAELRGSWLFWASCGLLAVVWVATALWQMPLHHQLLAGHDEGHVGALVRSNWIRTIAWTGRALIVVDLVFLRMQSAAK